MSLQRVMTFCCLAVWTLTAGACHASAADGAAAHFDFALPAVMSVDAAPSPLSGLTDAALGNVGRVMLDPERFSFCADVACQADVRVLPAAPAAVAMTLFGFLCVSLARDRRAWLGLAGGLICLGQAGMLTAPQLMRRICTRTAQETTQQSIGNLHQGAMAEGPAGYDETVRYVALLRKLAGIPAHGRGPALDSSNAHRRLNDGATAVRGTARSHMSHPAMPSPAEFTQASIVCPALADRHVVCFSPAFIFSNLSRSPPTCA